MALLYAFVSSGLSWSLKASCAHAAWARGGGGGGDSHVCTFSLLFALLRLFFFWLEGGDRFRSIGDGFRSIGDGFRSIGDGFRSIGDGFRSMGVFKDDCSWVPSAEALNKFRGGGDAISDAVWADGGDGGVASDLLDED